MYSKDCLDRFIVKSEYATITIPEIELTIPKNTQKGSIKTLEGYLSATADGLKFHQDARRLVDPDTAMKLDEFIEKLERMWEGKDMPYHFVIDDPSGNSYVQNPHAPAKDVYVTSRYYERSKKDLADMGFVDADTLDEEELKEERKDIEEEPKKIDHKIVKTWEFSHEEIEEMMHLARKRGEKHEERKEVDVIPAGFDYEKSIEEQSKDMGNINNEAFVIPMTCYQCGNMGVQKSWVSNIPHFKEIIIMAFNWEHCGYRSVEVKQGGGMSEKGKKVTLKVLNERDLTRDLYKGDNWSVDIPEIDLHLVPGSLGGLYTTVEGLIDKIHDKLEEANPFTAGDSSLDEKFRAFLHKLENLNEGKTEFTLILDDPLANWYIYSPFYPDPDPQVEVEEYERTNEQNEDLGINDMKVD